MPHPSKRAERVVLRRYADAAGGRDALIRWIDEALSEAKPRRGRKRYVERYKIATLLLLAEAKPKDRTKIFEQLIDEGHIKGVTSVRKSLVERARRNFRKAEKELSETVKKFKDAFDQLQLSDSIRAQIESQQRVKASGYNCPSVKQIDGRKHDTGRGRAPSAPERARPRSSRGSPRSKLPPMVRA
jgi:hypothetical protein